MQLAFDNDDDDDDDDDDGDAAALKGAATTTDRWDPVRTLKEAEVDPNRTAASDNALAMLSPEPNSPGRQGAALLCNALLFTLW